MHAQALELAKHERTAANRAAQQAAATLQDLEDRAPKNEDGASLVDQQRELKAAEDELERRLRPAVGAPAGARRLRCTGPSAEQMLSGVGARSFRSNMCDAFLTLYTTHVNSPAHCTPRQKYL